MLPGARSGGDYLPFFSEYASLICDDSAFCWPLPHSQQQNDSSAFSPSHLFSVTFTVSPSPSHSCWWGRKTFGSLEEYSKLREWQSEGPDPGPGPGCWKRMRKQGEGSQRGTHVGIFQIRKLTVGFDFFLCLYPLIQFLLKCSDTFLILVTSSPLPSLLYEIDSSQSLRSSVFSLPRSVLRLLLVSLLHHRWFPSLPSSMAPCYLRQHYPMELSTVMEMSYNLC